MLRSWCQHQRPWKSFCWIPTLFVAVTETPSLQLTNFSSQTPIVSLSSTQSTLLSHQVYLTDRIDNKKRDRMPHMKCVCFLQNNEDSLEALEEELREPKYGEYYLCQSVNHIGHQSAFWRHNSRCPRLQQHIEQDCYRATSGGWRVWGSERDTSTFWCSFVGSCYTFGRNTSRIMHRYCRLCSR